MDFSLLVATLALSHVTVWRLWAVVKAKADASSSASLIVLLGQSQLTGCLDKVSGIACFTPDTCIIVNLYCNVFSVKLQSGVWNVIERSFSENLEVCDQCI